jgi:hypothetical protein
MSLLMASLTSKIRSFIWRLKLRDQIKGDNGGLKKPRKGVE